MLYAERSYQGPLPDAPDLQAYEIVVPGSAATIIEVFAEQSRHRHKLERSIVVGSESRAGRGQWMAFVTLMSGVVGGCIVAVVGDPVAGAAIAGASLGSGALAYALGGRPPKVE